MRGAIHGIWSSVTHGSPQQKACGQGKIGIQEMHGGLRMRFGSTNLLRSGLRVLAIAAVVCSIAIAQNTQSTPNSPSTRLPAAGENPDDAPPRTAAPPASAQEPTAAEPTGEQPAGQNQSPSIVPEGKADDSGRFVFKKQVE